MSTLLGLLPMRGGRVPSGFCNSLDTSCRFTPSLSPAAHRSGLVFASQKVDRRSLSYTSRSIPIHGLAKIVDALIEVPAFEKENPSSSPSRSQWYSGRNPASSYSTAVMVTKRAWTAFMIADRRTFRSQVASQWTPPSSTPGLRGSQHLRNAFDLGHCEPPSGGLAAAIGRAAADLDGDALRFIV